MIIILLISNVTFWTIALITGKDRWLISIFAHLIYAVYKVLTNPKQEYEVESVNLIPVFGIIFGVLGLIIFGGPLGSAALILGLHSIRNNLKYGIGGVVLGTISLGWSVLIMILAAASETDE